MAEKRIIRVVKDARYFVASNEPFNDEHLSWGARGVMGYLLSKPDGWTCTDADLINQSPQGQRVVKRVVAELKARRYLRRFRINNAKGHLEWVTEIYESPSLNPEYLANRTAHNGAFGASPKGTKPNDGKPNDGKPNDGKPNDGKRTHIVSTEKVSTEKVSTEKVSTEAVSTKATAAAANPDLFALLKEAGINGKKRLELMQADHVTVAYAQAHVDRAAREGTPTGLLIHRMLEGDPAPAQPTSHTIPPELEGIIKR